MDVRSLVGWNLRRLRVERSISQDELALRAEVERAYVGHLERGTRNPTLLTLEKLATALECQMLELFQIPTRQETPPKPLRPGRRKP
ncbi:DNA-binding transcriptional regulator, XRE-family HTH domain [Nitratireductor aquibiodomus]|uniref:DNA-binding transcriptional regulator, XRE-family HTH domain n=1 Tax=Nitratireductor aquibiodomus TaxID=204799 RepID=A0A1H4KDX9_9HYPH|nr:helix-turn-helix transcriptional regulator [Nitratireductor aquibiodomus]SEB56760.1 DNA-binding transcriptional regulator, XRE-family HTH domain [Nitratireductor aquibiodomus]